MPSDDFNYAHPAKTPDRRVLQDHRRLDTQSASNPTTRMSLLLVSIAGSGELMGLGMVGLIGVKAIAGEEATPITSHTMVWRLA